MKTIPIALGAWCGLAAFLAAVFSILKRHDRHADRRDNDQ